MEAGTIAPGASAEEQERLAKAAKDADANDNGNGAAPEGAVEHDTGGEAEEPDIVTLEIDGDGQLTLTVGGAKPEVSTVKLVGGKMDVAGGDFDKGQEIKLLIHGVVAEVAFIDTRDQYGNISGTERRHKIRPLRVERLKD